MSESNGSESDEIWLWLDDERDPAEPFIQSRYGARGNETWVKTVEEAKALLRTGRVVLASLDHDLGDCQPTGSDLVNWLSEESFYGRLVIPQCRVHSDNVEGRRYMNKGIVMGRNRYRMGLEITPNRGDEDAD